MKIQKKWNCTIIALAMAMVLGVVDIHAVCVPCQDVVDDVLNRACNEFAVSPPNSIDAMVNTTVEIFAGILLDTELCDDGVPYRSSAAVCQENLLSQLDVSEAASVPDPELVPDPEPELEYDIYLSIKPSSSNANQYWISWNSGSGSGNGYGYFAADNLSQLHLFTGNGGAATVHDATIVISDGNSIKISGFDNANEVTGYDGDTRDFSLINDTYYLKDLGDDPPNVIDFNSPDTTYIDEMTFSSVGYLNLANDNSGIFRTNVLREPEPEPEPEPGLELEYDIYLSIKPSSSNANQYWISWNSGSGSGNGYGYFSVDNLSQLHLFTGNGGAATVHDATIVISDGNSIKISGFDNANEVTGYDGDTRDFSLINDTYYLKDLGDDPPNVIDFNSPDTTYIDEMTFSSVGYLNLANDNSGIFRTNVLREPEPEPEFDGTGPISFSPNLIRFTSNKQSQLAFIRLSEPVISPLDKDIGLTIKFTSNTSGISITPTEVYWSSVEDFQLIKTITVQVLTEINQDLNNFISIEVITNSELYKGLVPDFIVNYDNPNTEIRVRKEIHAMTVEQRTLFTQTYRQAWDAPESGLKDCADNYLTNFSRGLHNNGAFLPWHRGYLLQVENRLREISPNITIPYWDWSRSPRISQDSIWGAEPGQFSGNGGADGCVTDGPFGSESGFEMTNGGCLQRRITGGSAASATEVQNLLDRYPRASDYDLFRNRLEHGPGMHDSVHCLVGGTMCSARASNDPIFFLHHAMVDKIWSEWQAIVQEGRSAYTGDTSRDELMPGSPYTPGALLDMRRLPAAAAGGFVEVRYE